MNEDLKSALIQANTDLDTALTRVAGNEVLYFKLLHKFINDTNFNNLKIQMNEKKYKDAFIYAHTLKGVSGNLGLNHIYQHAAVLAEQLRTNNVSDIDHTFFQLEQAYTEIKLILQ